MFLYFPISQTQKTLFLIGFQHDDAKDLIFCRIVGLGILGGLKLDEIDATNSFLMLPMVQTGLKWPFKGHLNPVKNHQKIIKLSKNRIFDRVFSMMMQNPLLFVRFLHQMPSRACCSSRPWLFQGPHCSSNGMHHYYYCYYWNKWNAVISWKIWWSTWCITDLKWPLNGHFKPFRAIRSIRNGFGVQISSSLIPVMSKFIKFEPILIDFDGAYDDQHDHKNCYKPILDEFLCYTTICPWFV